MTGRRVGGEPRCFMHVVDSLEALYCCTYYKDELDSSTDYCTAVRTHNTYFEVQNEPPTTVDSRRVWLVKHIFQEYL